MNGTTMDRGTLVRGEEGLHQLVASLAEQNAQLEHALESRILIEQAKGLLAGEQGISLDQSFELLRGHARRNNAKLSAVADAVVNLGLLSLIHI